MERLWTPWRSEYVTTADDSDRCIFCAHLEAGDDEGAGIIYRGVNTFVLMNAFPYNTGHVMVAPTSHTGELGELPSATRHELMDVVDLATRAMQEALKPHGFNVGMNLGRVAGAGIPGHLHVHVVPRWGGDTNFMPVTADTKVMPETIDQTAAKLRPLFEREGEP